MLIFISKYRDSSILRNEVVRSSYEKSVSHNQCPETRQSNFNTNDVHVVDGNRAGRGVRIAFLVTGFRPAKGGLPVVMRRILLRSGERLWKKVTRRLMVGRNCDIAALFPSPSHFLFGSCRAVGRKINHLRIRPAFYTIWRGVSLHLGIGSGHR